MERHRITYLGASAVISSLGFTTEENFNAVYNGLSGVERDENGFCVARISDNRSLEERMIASVEDVVRQSGIDLSRDDVNLIFSTTKGAIEAIGKDESVYLWNLAERVASHFNLGKTPVVLSNACISGVSAVIVASRLIRSGRYESIVVVGGDLLSDFVVRGFDLFKSLSGTCCRPYDMNREGLNLGEACASVLVTADHSLSCGVVVEGGAVTNDANHISGPSRTGDGLCYAIRQAMSQSGLEGDDITFINAHGTATAFNDEMESKAIRMAGLESVPVNSLKSYFGHTLGASGVVELVMCVEQLKRGVLFGTKGFERLGVPEEILVSGAHHKMEMSRCVKTASGFGGCNAAVVLSLEKYAKDVTPFCDVQTTQVAECTIRNGEVKLNGHLVFQSEGTFGEFIRAAFRSLNTPNMKFYKMDDLCKLGYMTAEYLLKDRSYLPAETAVIMANRSSSLDTDQKHQQLTGGEASPAVFVYTLPNIVLGEICIRHKIQGENTFFVFREKEWDFMKDYAELLLSGMQYKTMIYGWCELVGEQYDSKMLLIEKR